MPKKLSDDTPGEKLITLFTLLLYDPKAFSLTELAHELGCSKPSVLRYIDQLEKVDIAKVIRETRGREAVYRLNHHPKPMLSVNAEGLRQLALCRDFLVHLLPKSVSKSMETTLRQASSYVAEGEAAYAPESFGESFTKGRIDYTPYQKQLDTLLKAIRLGKVCVVSYKKSLNDAVKTYDYAPKKVTAFHETLYISGWIVTDKGKATAKWANSTRLALQRVQDVVLTRRDAGALPDPPETSEGFGLMAGEPFQVKVRFSPQVATYVAEREWSKEQRIKSHNDGAITLTLQVRSWPECMGWVLSFGEHAELLAPKDKRREIAERTRALAAIYGKTTAGKAI